jgi:hypothetical protein
MNLTQIRNEVMTYVESLHCLNAPYGHYRLTPDREAELYAACDVAILRTVMGEDLKKSLTDSQRGEWINNINSFAQENGIYRGGRHTDEHRNGTVIGALGVLGGKQLYPVQLYKGFSEIEKINDWLEAIDWRHQWGASHLFWGGMHCFSMSKACTEGWRNAVFDWLDENLDPETGWWRIGVEPSDTDQPLGGGAHIWPIYQHNDRAFPHPERLIDSILALQKPDASWREFGDYLDLDALYGLSFMQSLAPDYRKSDIGTAVRRHGDLAEEKFPHFLDEKKDIHLLLGAVGVLGLLNQLDPERFTDDRAWSDIFSDIKLYQTALVEC